MKKDKEDTSETEDSSENEGVAIEEDADNSGQNVGNGQGQEKPLETMPGENRPVQHPVLDASKENVQEVTQEQLQAYILTKLLEGSSYRELSQQVGIPKSTLQKYYPKSYIDNVRLSLQKQQEEKLRTEQAPIPRPQQEPIYQEPLGQTALPPGSIVFTPELITSIRSGLSAQQQRIFDMALNVAAQRQGQMIGHSQASPPGSLDAAEAQLVAEMAKSVRFKRYQDMQRGYSPSNNPRSAESTLKDAADFIKFGAALVSPNKQQDPLGIYRTGREDAKGELSRLGKSGETNPLDLRLEELRESHDIDMHKIGFEQKKFFLQLESERDKWERIQETFAPVLQMAAPEIRDSIRKLGESIGRGIGGAAPKTQNANMVPTKCPKCGATLNIPIPENAKGDVSVKCPKCGELFQMEEEKQPEPELRPKGKLESRYT